MDIMCVCVGRYMIDFVGRLVVVIHHGCAVINHQSLKRFPLFLQFYLLVLSIAFVEGVVQLELSCVGRRGVQ